MSIQAVRDRVEQIILDELNGTFDLNDTEFLINPTGRFVIGGPDGDTGLTGRKIIVDTYGGYAPWRRCRGKDCTKHRFSSIYGLIWQRTL